MVSRRSFASVVVVPVRPAMVPATNMARGRRSAGNVAAAVLYVVSWSASNARDVLTLCWAQINMKQGPFHMQMGCQACGGEGTFARQCVDCKGAGISPESATVTVSIPPGSCLLSCVAVVPKCAQVSRTAMSCGL